MMAAPMKDVSPDENLQSTIEDFAAIAVDPPTKRNVCGKCGRPSTVCWCPYLPAVPVDVKTKVYILQHPFEESRRLRTAPMLYHSLPAGSCHIYRGKRFALNTLPELQSVIASPDTVLLFPGNKSEDLETLISTGETPAPVFRNVILIDGTWPQAKGLYFKNEFLHNLKQVHLKAPGLSEYVIRTQPTDSCLSTLETAALAISLLEKRPDLYQTLVRPLKALCEFQLQHGAVRHHSKQYLIENGLFRRPNHKEDSTKELDTAKS